MTMDSDRRAIRGDVLIEGDRIKKLGEFEEDNADKVLNAENKIVMPGLVCSHCRPYRILLQSAPLNADSHSDYVQILQNILWPMDEELDKEDIYRGSLAAFLELIKTGVTFVSAIHSSQNTIGKSLDEVSSALDSSGLRGIIGFEASERHTRAQGARGMRENIRFLENLQNEDFDESRINGMVSLALSSKASDELLKHAKRVSERFDVPLVLPAGKGKIDNYHNLEEYGKRTIERYRDAGILSSNTVLTNSIGLSNDDLAMIERNRTSVSAAPVEDSLRSLGVARVPDMRERGINVGLGSDGFCFDGFRNLQYIYLLQKLESGDPRVLSSMEAIEMATIEAASIYGMEDEIGSIEPGKRADIILLDISSYKTPIGRRNVAEHLVHSAGREDVKTVIVGGKILMEDGIIKTLDEKKVIEQSKKSAKKIWKKLEGL